MHIEQVIEEVPIYGLRMGGDSWIFHAVRYRELCPVIDSQVTWTGTDGGVTVWP